MSKSTRPSGQGFGKPKRPRQPNVQQTQSSRSYARALGVLSLGEIEGLQGGHQGIFLDDTPLQNADLSYNFQGVAVDWRPGTQNQSRIPGFAENVASERPVGQEVLQPLPVTRSIINPELDGVVVTVKVLLEEYPPDGGVLGSAMVFRLWVKEGNGAFVLRGEPNIIGRFNSPTEFQYFLPVSNLGGTVSNFQVRVERLTPQQSNTDRYRQILTWSSVTEIVETRLRYPHSALLAIQLDATHFESVPNFTFLVTGRKIKIPTNAGILPNRSLFYSGVWNGLFQQAAFACNDPAWILWDLLTSKLYGMGRTISESMLDKWAFYRLSQYCCEQIPDGFGGTEPRFACNVALDRADDAWRVVDLFRGIFRGFAYYQDGALSISADAPGTPEMAFSQADVVDGVFTYSSPPLADRYSVASVRWRNPQDNYSDEGRETVEIDSLIQQYGYRVIELDAFACTSRGQARRLGHAALLQPDSVTFRARAYGGQARPGMIIKILDSRRAAERLGGFIVDSTINTVTLDYPVVFRTGSTIQVGAEERAIASIAGMVVTTITPFSAVPPAGASFAISTPDVVPQLFRVINVIPDAESDNTIFEIFAIEHNPSKFAAIEQGLSLQPIAYRNWAPKVVTPPNSLSLSSVTLGNVTSLLVGWRPPEVNGVPDPFIRNYLVEWRRGSNGSWEDTRSTGAPGLEIGGLQPGYSYVARVAAQNSVGDTSLWIESAPIYLSPPNIYYDWSDAEATLGILL